MAFLIAANPVDPPPSPPSAVTLTATAASSTAINLSWSGGSGVTTWNVYRGTSTGFTVGAGSLIEEDLSSGTTAFGDTGLTAETEYFYVVRATNAGGSTDSNEDSATTEAASATPTWRGNEPTGIGLTELVDTDFNFTIPAGASQIINQDGIFATASNGDGNMSIVTDQDGPYSSPRAYQLRYPAGLGNGDAAGTFYGFFPNNTTHTYACWWMKYDPDYEFNAVSEKTFILDVDVILQTRWGGQWLNLVWGANEYDPNQSITPDLSDGEWHMVEFYCHTTSGTLQVWWNGDLVTSYTGVTSGIPATRDEWQLLGIWGGSGAARSTTGYRWVDHLYISSATD